MPSTNFQKQITSAINTVGVLAGLTGVPQGKQEKKALENTLKAADEIKGTLSSQLEDKTLGDAERKAVEKTIEHINNQVEAHSERIAELRPSGKNIQNLMDAYTTTGRNRARIEQTRLEREKYQEELAANKALQEEMFRARGESGRRYDEDKASQAMKRSQEQAEARSKRRNFVRDYLPKIETNFGGTVGDFSKETQRELGKNYSAKERKEIMDRMDKENKAKGGKE